MSRDEGLAVRRIPLRRWASTAAVTVSCLGAAGLAAVACTQDAITGPDPDAGPRPSPATVESIVDATQLPGWRDTTLVGFGVAADAPLQMLAERPDFRARILGRFDVPDTVRSGADTARVEQFLSGEIQVRVDTARSEIPTLPVTLELYELERGFDRRDVDWERAAEGEPWDSPGGDLGNLIATGLLDFESDSVGFELPDPDELLGRWRDQGGEPGFAIRVATPDVWLRTSFIRLRFTAELEGVEREVAQVLPGSPSTFIYDPPQPDPGTALRVGGLPGSRFYVEFLVPDTVNGVPLSGATVNRAELRFHPLDEPPFPFILQSVVGGRPVRLLADPFVLGHKTPIGPPAPSAVLFRPDSLAAGVPIRIDVTTPIQAQAAGQTDPSVPLRLGIRWEPDAVAFGYWDFGSAEAPPGFRPELEIILTAPPEFGAP